MNSKVIAAVALSVFFGATVFAYAHGGATGIVKERMDGMMAMGQVIKELSAMMRGEVDYSADAVQAGAKIIESHAGASMTTLFPEGSTQESSEARDDIWSDWETFTALADQLAVYAKGLAAAAKNGVGMPAGSSSSMMGTAPGGMTGQVQSTMMGSGPSGMMAAVKPMMSAGQLAAMPADRVFNIVAQTCSACHTKFRLEKK